MRHNDDKKGFFFHRNYLYQNFGSSRYPKNWKKINERFGFFEKQSIAGSRVYYLTESGMSEIEKHIEETLYEESDWIDLDTNKVIDKLPTSMLALDACGKRAIRPANLLPNLVEINVEALDHGMRVLEQIKAGLPLTRGAGAISDYVIDQRIEQLDEVEWARRCIAAIKSLIYEATNPVWGIGKRPQCYQQVISGRWYSHDGLGFTSVRKLVRKLAFWNLYDYDLDNAQLSLLLQLSGRDYWPALINYLENKSDVRQEIAFDVGISIDQVKAVFLAIIFGAPRKGPAIRKILNGRHHEFMDQSTASAIVKEIQLASRLVVSAAKGQCGKWVVNAMGRGVSRDKKDRQILAHLCQGAEALILKTVLDSPWGSSVVVPIHDGWFANEQMPVDELEKFVCEQTGFQVSIREDKD